MRTRRVFCYIEVIILSDLEKDKEFQFNLLLKEKYIIIPDDEDIQKYLKKVKPFKTYNEQLQLLKDRNLIIPDEAKAIELLKRINYYRLTAYTLTLKKDNVFYPNVTFDDIIQLYCFDVDFRSLILKYASYIEIAIRSYVAYYHAKLYGSLGYLNSNYFQNKHYHTTFLKVLKESLQSSKDTFIEWHKTDKNGIFPFWVAIEETSFGCVSQLYKNLIQKDRKQIAKIYYGISNEQYIENWLQCTVVARNIAAHGGRFYNRINIRPKVLLGNKLNQVVDNGRPFAFLYAMFRLLTDGKKYDMIQELKKLFKKYPFVDMRYLGFPTKWEKIFDYSSL